LCRIRGDDSLAERVERETAAMRFEVNR
jgi:hypothetical protein